jgi:hypothetical protein
MNSSHDNSVVGKNSRFLSKNLAVSDVILPTIRPPVQPINIPTLAPKTPSITLPGFPSRTNPPKPIQPVKPLPPPVIPKPNTFQFPKVEQPPVTYFTTDENEKYPNIYSFSNFFIDNNGKIVTINWIYGMAPFNPRSVTDKDIGLMPHGEIQETGEIYYSYENNVSMNVLTGLKDFDNNGQMNEGYKFIKITPSLDKNNFVAIGTDNYLYYVYGSPYHPNFIFGFKRIPQSNSKFTDISIDVYNNMYIGILFDPNVDQPNGYVFVSVLDDFTKWSKLDVNLSNTDDVLNDMKFFAISKPKNENFYYVIYQTEKPLIDFVPARLVAVFSQNQNTIKYERLLIKLDAISFIENDSTSFMYIKNISELGNLHLLSRRDTPLWDAHEPINTVKINNQQFQDMNVCYQFVDKTSDLLSTLCNNFQFVHLGYGSTYFD